MQILTDEELKEFDNDFNAPKDCFCDNDKWLCCPICLNGIIEQHKREIENKDSEIHELKLRINRHIYSNQLGFFHDDHSIDVPNLILERFPD